MRASSLVKQIIGLKSLVVREVSLLESEILVELKLTRTKLGCPKCKHKTHLRYDSPTTNSRQRNTGYGVRETWLSCSLRRLKVTIHHP